MSSSPLPLRASDDDVRLMNQRRKRERVHKDKDKHASKESASTATQDNQVKSDVSIILISVTAIALALLVVAVVLWPSSESAKDLSFALDGGVTTFQAADFDSDLQLLAELERKRDVELADVRMRESAATGQQEERLARAERLDLGHDRIRRKKVNDVDKIGIYKRAMGVHGAGGGDDVEDPVVGARERARIRREEMKERQRDMSAMFESVRTEAQRKRFEQEAVAAMLREREARASRQASANVAAAAAVDDRRPSDSCLSVHTYRGCAALAHTQCIVDAIARHHRDLELNSVVHRAGNWRRVALPELTAMLPAHAAEHTSCPLVFVGCDTARRLQYVDDFSQYARNQLNVDIDHCL
jgi:hypothetical protein